MTCPECQRNNDAQRRFCGDCGARLTTICGRCAFDNGIDDRFCGGCGESLAAAGPSLEVVKLPVVEARPAEIDPQLSKGAVEELLAVRRAHLAPTLPSKVTQDDLDDLFAR